MRLPIPPTTLFLSIFGVVNHGRLVASAAQCSKVVTAKAGDTCASISQMTGITVSQFLLANPSVSTCASLVAGIQYCVDPTFAATTTTTAGPAPTGGLQVSVDGECGNGLTCLGSSYGSCCSEHGWCGSTDDHCGVGCQAAFGVCGAAAVNSSTAGGAVATATVYVTQTIQTTRVVTTTATAAVATATVTVRQTVPTTVTVPGAGGPATATRTVTATATIPVAGTSTTVVTSKSLVIISSTLTTIKTVTITDARLCRATNLPRATAGQLSPVQPEAASDCALRHVGGL